LEFEDVGFCGGKKSGVPGENPAGQGEKQRQTQSTYDIGAESNLRHIGGWKTKSTASQRTSD